MHAYTVFKARLFIPRMIANRITRTAWWIITRTLKASHEYSRDPAALLTWCRFSSRHVTPLTLRSVPGSALWCWYCVSTAPPSEHRHDEASCYGNLFMRKGCVRTTAEYLLVWIRGMKQQGKSKTDEEAMLLHKLLFLSQGVNGGREKSYKS